MRTKDVEVKQESIGDFGADTLILPIPGDRLSENETLRTVLTEAGQDVLPALENDLPLRPGNVSVTPGGDLNYERIVHIPVQSAPGVPTTEENLQVGLRSGLVAADEEGTRTVALPQIIPEDQRDEVNYESTAETVIRDLLQYPPAHFSQLTLISQDPDWTDALKNQLTEP
ncbi:MAG: macro domain-containing protein [bacterium]